MQPLADKDVFRYLRLEEGDATVELLRPDSLRYLGAHPTSNGVGHFWSYPTAQGVAWVELNAKGSLAITDEVPRSVRDATPSRSQHKVRPILKQPAAPPSSRRVRPQQATWVPLNELPACHYHEAWHENASFDMALKYYGAKAIRDGSAGPGTRFFYIQLSSGRYACIENRRSAPQTLVISLEVDPRGAGKNSGGKVFVCDIEEILRPMGGTFVMPTGNTFIRWSQEPA